MREFGSIDELVSIVYRKDTFQQTLRPNQATTYTADRDIQLPPEDGTAILVSADSTQILTNKTISGASNTISGISLTSGITGVLPAANGGTGIANSSTLTYGSSGITLVTSGTTSVTLPTSGTLATLSGTETLNNKVIANTSTIMVKDSLLSIQDDGDTTKVAQFQASGITTGTTRTYTFPDVSMTLSGQANSETLSNKTLDNTSVITIKGSNLRLEDASDTTKQAQFGLSGISTATLRTFGLPDANTTLVGADATQTLTNKTIAGGSNTISGISLTSSVTGTLPIANGGTSGATAILGFNALSPITTKGDLISSDGTNNVRFGVGSNGKVLTADSTQTSGLNWSTPLTNPMTTSQDIIVGGSAGAATRLAVGANNTILTVNGSGTLTYAQIVDANVATGAAIAYVKLSLTGDIVNADISTSAAIAGSKLQAAGTSNVGTVSYEASGSFTVPWIQNSLAHSSVSVLFTKVGKLVTLTFNSNVNTSKGATDISAAGVVPSAMRPMIQTTHFYVPMNNSAIINSPCGLLIVDTNGTLTLRLVADDTSNFSASGNCGMYYGMTMSYVTA